MTNLELKPYTRKQIEQFYTVDELRQVITAASQRGYDLVLVAGCINSLSQEFQFEQGHEPYQWSLEDQQKLIERISDFGIDPTRIGPEWMYTGPQESWPAEAISSGI